MPTGVRIGDREIFLLSMLIGEKLYGYQIAQRIRDHASFFVEIDQSGVYNALRKLEKTSWISVELENASNAPTRKLYQITEGGKKALESTLFKEPGQTRLSILGTLNLLINSSWLPPEQMNKFLTARIMNLENLLYEQSGNNGRDAEDLTTEYLKDLIKIELKYGSKLRKRTK